MKRALSMLGACTLLALPAWGSQPGQPLDCSDWVIVEPGLSCQPVFPFPCSAVDGYGSYDPACEVSSDIRAIDNEGNLLWVREVPGGITACIGQPNRLELLQISRGTQRLLAYI